MVLRRVAVNTGAVVGVSLYFGLEAIVRCCNIGRKRRAVPVVDLGAIVSPAGFAALPDPLASVQFDKVRVVAPARLPIPHVGITLGHSVFLRHPLDLSRRADQELLLHELVHVGQREREGRLGMAYAYGRGFCEAMSYRRHPMEVEARHVAREIHHRLGNPVE